MPDRLERNLGEQPLAGLMSQHGLKPRDVVAASETQMTHKMVSRAVKGRWLTPHARQKVLKAFNAAADASYSLRDLFNY